MEIISVDASHPGANHDSFIWSHHPLKTHLENLSSAEALWLLGKIGSTYLIIIKKFTSVPNINSVLGSNFSTSKNLLCLVFEKV